MTADAHASVLNDLAIRLRAVESGAQNNETAKDAKGLHQSYTVSGSGVANQSLLPL